ncbi:MAG: hypothetical protein IT379_32030 [Deltaproteobacteria bacterium]|nr:hypothetical protein [Deltaproteobacteria bacterium]
MTCSLCHRRPRAPGLLDCAECASRAADEERDAPTSPGRQPGDQVVTWSACAGAELGRIPSIYDIPERGFCVVGSPPPMAGFPPADPTTPLTSDDAEGA